MKDNSFGIIPLRREGEKVFFLLIHHKAGHWSFPKGHANPGELPLETAKREFIEETGVSEYELVDNVCFKESYVFTNAQGESVEKTVEYYLAWIRGEGVRIHIEELQNYCWLEFEDAVKQVTFEEGRHLLNQVRDYLK